MIRFILPLITFLVLVGFLAVGLQRDPREVPSPLIGKPSPAFTAQRLDNPQQKIRREDLLGKVWMLNVWASWCSACREEHPVLVAFAKGNALPIYGLDYKDKDPEAKAWLDKFGNPYTASLIDTDGRIGLDFGVYGVPETFLMDKGGVVRYKHIGPLSPEVIKTKIQPMIEELNRV